jgi:hypothetical protein
MNPSNSNNHLVQLDSDRKMATGARKFLAGIASLPVGSQTLTPEQIAQVFDARASLCEALQAASAARTAAVKAYQDKRSETAPFVSAFRRVVQGMFAQSPDTLAEFGLTAPKPADKSVVVKAAAIAKSKATRAARHTMGKKQKQAVKGGVTRVVVTPVMAPTPSPGTAPAPAPAPAPATPPAAGRSPTTRPQ